MGHCVDVDERFVDPRERSKWRLFVRRLREDRSASLGFILIAGLVICAVFAPWLATYPDDVWALHPTQRLMPPSTDYLFGTDRMGSDMFSRVLFGARITIVIGLIAVGASLIIGVPIGLVAGFYDGWHSNLLMRTSDIFLASAPDRARHRDRANPRPVA